ncbi:hypothetical protein CVD28_19535 [Bacillus sp. M6-12]|uniref:Na-translocating system protein MpsC family protein n=1 Tax=Bacillus sp. M6-12 TaxID=2054166 RepID=UPI000C780416|nr:Na-translocating system protein MpsC family protein [Bacillus sp. M6-12]PLS15937.1 hypothetical protein CVD28_19535 [Bacillus sp. M6-12]
MENKSPELEIASYIGKLLRDNFGKGPESVFVSISEPYICIHIRNFISPIEIALLKQEKENTVQNTRELVFQSLVPEIKAYIKGLSNIEISEFYYDWGLHNKSGAFIGIAANPEKVNKKIGLDFARKKEADQKITEISQEVQKAPDELYSFMINERTILFIRIGILIRIEKELIRQGYGEILKTTKRILEKKYLHNNEFEAILNRKIVDIFVDWDLDLDKSVIVFFLKPKD